MNLSIRAAAEEAPAGAALIFAGQTLSYEALAERVKARLAEGLAGDPTRPFPLVAAPTLEVLVTLLACFEAQRPIGLLSPRWTSAQRSLQSARLAACRPLGTEGDRRAAACLFTSGTTGDSKIVELSRGSFLAAAKAHALSQGWEAADRWLLSLSFAHIGGLNVLTRSLIARKPVVVSREGSFDPSQFLETVLRTQATLVSLVPTQLELLMAFTERAPQSLRLVLLGGSAARPELLERAVTQGWPVVTTYGMTETCAQVATGSPGTALPGVELRVVEGVIEVRSPTLLTAYHDQRGSRSPLGAEGWFRTGDLGALDAAGRLTVRGRADDVIITGGEKVNPVDVEHVLEQVPGVSEACVVGLADPIWGHVVAAVLVARSPPDPELLRAALHRGLAKFQQPKRWLFVEALPRTPAGKLDRRATAELLSQPPAA